MARRTLNRRALRDAAEAAERRKEDEELDDEDEEEADEDADSEDEENGDEEEVAEEETPKKKKKKVVKEKPAKRTRTVKLTRMRAVWTVFNNSHQPVARFDYPKKADAVALAAKLTADKKSTHFVQMIKEPIEEKEKADSK